MTATYFSREVRKVVANAGVLAGGHSSGFDVLDNVSLLRAGELTLVAARPGIGKSSFMADLVLNMSNRMPALVFSCEMSNGVLSERLVANMAEIPPKLLPTDLSENDRKKLDKTMTKLENRDIVLDDTAGVTPKYVDDCMAKFADVVRKCKTAGKYPTETALVCIDYLQLMRPNEKNRARYEEVDEMVYSVRESAKKHNMIVVLLCQLNREVDNRKSFEPRLSDLRESGGIEQAGDLILMLHRPAYYKMQEFGVETPDDGEAFVIVAKNRQGPTGKMRCVWVPEIMSFRSIGGWAEEDSPELDSNLLSTDVDEPKKPDPTYEPVEDKTPQGGTQTVTGDLTDSNGTPIEYDTTSVDLSDCQNDSGLPDLFAGETPDDKPEPHVEQPEVEMPDDDIPF